MKCLLAEYATVTGEWVDFHAGWQAGGAAAIQPANPGPRMTSPGTVSGRLIMSFMQRSSVITYGDLC